MQFGIPKVVTSDQGSEFNNNLDKELMKLLNVDHRLTSPYHPQVKQYSIYIGRGSGEGGVGGGGGGGGGGARGAAAPVKKLWRGLAPLKLFSSIIRDTLIEQSQYSLRSSVASYVCSYK